nr:sigma-54-dependent Fis family transcriptional regulator [Bacteroidota bacterium]
MNIKTVIKLLLIEDEDFDVARVKSTVSVFSNRISVDDVVSNGKAALKLLQKNPDLYDVVILDYQISGGL